MTQGIRKTMEDMTGYNVATCPWAAFNDPFVQRVLSICRWTAGEDGGALSELHSDPSNKLVQGYALYRAVDARMRARQMEIDRQNNRQKSGPERHG